MNGVYIIGAGGHGADVAELVTASGYEIAGFIDDQEALTGKSVLAWKVLGKRHILPAGATVALAVGDLAARAELLDYLVGLGCEMPVLIHPSAVVSPSAIIDSGTVIMAQSFVGARARIGSASLLGACCSVAHDCAIERLVHIAPGARLGAYVGVGERTLVGIGACVRPGTRIGRECVIGAGSVVVKDIAAGSCAYGNPARVRTDQA